MDLKKSHEDGTGNKKFKNNKTPSARNQHRILGSFGDAGGCYRAVTCLWRDVPCHSRGLSRIQGFEARNAVNRFGFIDRVYGGFHLHSYCNNLINNNLILKIIKIMSKVFLLGANASYDTGKQAVAKNQIIRMNGYEDDRYVVYDITEGHSGLIYRLINLRTHRFGQCDLIRPLSEKFGIGYYYDDENPQFMDAFEAAVLRSEAEQAEKAEMEEIRQEQEDKEQLKTVGRERLQKLVPADAKAVIIAELHEDDSDPMTDYFGYHTARTVILGFSTHTKDLFPEMRRYAANFEGTAHLAEENKEYEHREKYSMGAGYYLGKSRHSGWSVKKEKFYGEREQTVERYALIAGDEANICVKVRTEADRAKEAVTGDFIIVDYSEKALAVFGDTRPVKDELKALGGRFNPNLTHNEKKQAGWIFSKAKESDLRNLLTVK
jgi:hypothetical protein